MKRLLSLFLSIIFFSSCGLLNHQKSELSCPANTVSTTRTSSSELSCPANTISTETTTKAGLNCPANTITEAKTKTSAHSSCPPAAFGAEKLIAYLDKKEAPKHPTAKTDPLSGKKTSKKKGIRTGEIEKTLKPSKEEKYQAAKKRKEEKLLAKQIRRDEKLAKKDQPLF